MKMIGELAREVSMRPSTIRYYELEGLLAPPRRVSGRRVYDGRAALRLRAIAALQGSGFRLAEIRALLPRFDEFRTPSSRWREAARAKVAELDATIDELSRVRRTLAEASECVCGGDPVACDLVDGLRRGVGG